jgi:hypothetical protein
MQNSQFRSAPDIVHVIIDKEGFKGLYVVCIPCDLLLSISSRFIILTKFVVHIVESSSRSCTVLDIHRNTRALC